MGGKNFGKTAGLTLIELLLALGVLALIVIAATRIFGASGGGGGGGGSAVPGADEYIQNIQNVENVESQLGGAKPNDQVCKILRTYYDNAEKGFNNMVTSGSAGPALQPAKARLEKAKTYIDANCPG